MDIYQLLIKLQLKFLYIMSYLQKNSFDLNKRQQTKFILIKICFRS